MRTLKFKIFLMACLIVLISSLSQGYNYVPVSGSFISDNAVFTDQKVPNSMDVEHIYTLSYTVKNTGDNTWKKGDYKLKVTVTAADVSKNNKWLVPNVDLPNDVAPGAEVTITFKITAWNDDGDYSFQAQMSKNDVPFGAPSSSVAVNVH